MKKSLVIQLQIWLTISFLAISTSAFSQLSGTYTLGDPDSDYLTFSDAVNDIKTQGLQGDVEFLVKPGTYNNISINDIENPNAFNIRFAYNQTIGDSAQIIGRLEFFNTSNVEFSNFFITPALGQHNSCVEINMSSFITFSECKIINIQNVEFDNYEALIKLSFPWEGPYYAVNINNCEINSIQNTILYSGKKGSVWFVDNSITGIIKDRYGYVKKHYNNNLFYLTDSDFAITSQYFHGNIFYSEYISYLTIQGELINNVFYTSVNMATDDALNNIFHGSASVIYCNNANITKNVFKGNFNSLYSHGIRIRNNVFYDNVNLNNDNTSFGNNLVFGSVEFSHGPGQLIYNNNFKTSSLLKLFYTGGRLRNNNLGNLYIEQSNISAWQIDHNNFINLGDGNVCCYGDQPYFQNPMYKTDTLLYATNPILIGKGGNNHPKFKYDIDSVLRKEPCTIGANEICFDWEVNEININCSDSLQLDLCLDTLENMYWSPAYLFDDTTSTNPLIFPDDSTTIYLHDYDGTILDSLIINTTAIQPITKVTYLREGLTVSFNNKSFCADTYLWNFGDGNTSTEKSPTHTYEMNGSYQCTLKISNYLGDAYWAVLLNVVSVNETLVEPKGLIVFPNPANNYISVKSIREISNIRLYNIKGELLYKRVTNNDRQVTVDVKSLPTGLYLIKVQTGNTINSLLFSKQ